jgi:Cu/Ag efflux pump CusA
MIAKIIEASIRQRFFVIIATLLVIGIAFIPYGILK